MADFFLSQVSRSDAVNTKFQGAYENEEQISNTILGKQR